MNLVEAFDIVNRRSEEFSKEERRLAQQCLFEEIKRLGEGMQHDLGGEFDYEDVIQDAFLKLNRSTSELTNRSEGGARGRIRKTLKSIYLDSCRKKNRQPKLSLDDDDGGGEQVFDGEIQPANLEEGAILNEELKDSDIVDEPESAAALNRQLCAYLMEVVIPLKVRREPYRSDAREQVEQMFQLSEGECTWEELVDAEVDEEASEKEREKVRNRIQQRHSRTRKRMRAVLDEADENEKYEAVSRLSDFDRRLLYRALEELRQRRRSSS